MRIADRLWINAETATFSALAQQPYKQKVLRRKNAKTRKFTKKSSSQGEDFFASCLLVHKLCLIFTSYLATHKLFLTLQAVCRHTIVSIFANCLVIHNFFNLQVVCFQTIYFNFYKPFAGANNCFNFSQFQLPHNCLNL